MVGDGGTTAREEGGLGGPLKPRLFAHGVRRRQHRSQRPPDQVIHMPRHATRVPRDRLASLRRPWRIAAAHRQRFIRVLQGMRRAGCEAGRNFARAARVADEVQPRAQARRTASERPHVDDDQTTWQGPSHPLQGERIPSTPSLRVATPGVPPDGHGVQTTSASVRALGPWPQSQTSRGEGRLAGGQRAEGLGLRADVEPGGMPGRGIGATGRATGSQGKQGRLRVGSLARTC